MVRQLLLSYFLLKNLGSVRPNYCYCTSSAYLALHMKPLDPLYIKVYQQLTVDLYIWCRIYISLAGFRYLMLDLYICRIYINIWCRICISDDLYIYLDI